MKMEMLETKDYQEADEQLASTPHTSTTESLNEDVPPSIISQFDSENELSMIISCSIFPLWKISNINTFFT